MSSSPDVIKNEKPFKQPNDIEKQQEEMLKSKYPNLKPKGPSNLLQKRIAQKTKYFDSGDYNMARAQMANKQKIAEESSPDVKNVTGDHMPTPDEIPRIRKPSQSTLVTGHIYPS